VRRLWRLYPTYLAAIVLRYSLLRSGAPVTSLQCKSKSQAGTLTNGYAHNLFASFCASREMIPILTGGMEERLYDLYGPYLLLRRRVFRAGTVMLIVGHLFGVELGCAIPRGRR